MKTENFKYVTICYTTDTGQASSYTTEVNAECDDAEIIKYFTSNQRFCTGWPAEDENATKTKVILKDHQDKTLRAYQWPMEINRELST